MGRGEGKLNMLLLLDTNEEGWDVDHLAADTEKCNQRQCNKRHRHVSYRRYRENKNKWSSCMRMALKNQSEEVLPDVSLADEYTSMVKGLGKVLLEDKSLEATGHDVRHFDGENVIQLFLVLLQETEANASSEESLSFEDTLGVLLVKSEQLTSVGTHLGEEELNAPNLTLVLEAELTNDFHLIVKTLLLEGTPWSLRSLRIFTRQVSRTP